MKIFINDIPVSILEPGQINPRKQFDHVIDGSKKINSKLLIDDVLINHASPEKIDELLKLMTDKKFKDLDSITFTSLTKKELIRFIKTKFKVIEAAGGVVDKDGKTLVIFRKGFWDIPKGKIDKGEKKKACAIREVEEETGVKVSVQGKIGTTWHTYVTNRRYILKKTHWYVMTCLDDSHIGPQTEEDIEQVRWMNLTELRAALYGSYRSIRVVIQEYHKLLKITQSS